jgi:hypothetical protein
VARRPAEEAQAEAEAASVNVSVAVQHHPARAHLLDRLVDALGGAEVVVDPDPDSPYRSPFRTYMEALRRTPTGATHRLIVQDDALPCAGFRDRMLEAVAEKPDVLVALFAPGASTHRVPITRAALAGERWAQLRPTWVPTVALVWPVELVPRFVAWADDRYAGSVREGDDGPVGKWAARNHLRAWATVPSLVEHPDVEPSLIGRKHRAGANRARVAAMFAGDA